MLSSFAAMPTMNKSHTHTWIWPLYIPVHVVIYNYNHKEELFVLHTIGLRQPVQNSTGRWYVVIIIILLCLASLRISFGKCLAAAVMMPHWKWVEVHHFTA